MFAYHHQKENLGWAGVAAYLAAVAAIGLTRPGTHHSIMGKIFLTVIVIISLVLVIGYVRRQLNLREWSTRLNFAYNRAILEILVSDLPPLLRNFVPDSTSPRENGTRFPVMFLRMIFPARLHVLQEQAVLHPKLIRLIPKPDTDKRPRDIEFITYGVMVIISLLTILTGWLSG